MLRMKHRAGRNLTAIALTIGLVAIVSSCGVNPNDAQRVLEAQGMTAVQIGGHAWFGCSKSDDLRSKFTAIGVNGKPVSGVVCGGWFGKSITVRYD